MGSWMKRDRTETGYAPQEGELLAAYERGRRDERARNRGKRHPILTIAVALVALVGGAALVLAAINGGFGPGGQVLDTQIAQATDQAVPAVQGAVSDVADRNEPAQTAPAPAQTGG